MFDSSSIGCSAICPLSTFRFARPHDSFRIVRHPEVTSDEGGDPLSGRLYEYRFSNPVSSANRQVSYRPRRAGIAAEFVLMPQIYAVVLRVVPAGTNSHIFEWVLPCASISHSNTPDSWFSLASFSDVVVKLREPV
jgi:hypothetical protein